MHATIPVRGDAIAARPATADDARFLAHIADIAGEGLPSHLWTSIAKSGQTPLDVGADRAARDRGAFSWRNARVATWRGVPAGAIVAYDLHEFEAAEVSPLLEPLLELEALAAGTLYINMLGTVPEARDRGIARMLLREVAAGTTRDLSLIVASGNGKARRLYRALDFDDVARRAMGPGGPAGLNGDWILLRRPAAVIREPLHDRKPRARIPA